MSDTTPGRVAVVTGASSGIGEATARAWAADGYRVALIARRLHRITAVADELDNGSIAIGAATSSSTRSCFDRPHSSDIHRST